MKNTYEIWFGVDPEKLPNNEWTWPDEFNRSSDFLDKYTVGTFITNNKNFFWEVFKNVVENPPSMWYWVIINNTLQLSGAIDPYDIESLEEILSYYK